MRSDFDSQDCDSRRVICRFNLLRFNQIPVYLHRKRLKQFLTEILRKAPFFIDKTY